MTAREPVTNSSASTSPADEIVARLTPAPIEEFLGRYSREYDFYQEAARLAAVRLEAALVENGIRAIVTSRAKRLGSLRTKCEKRSLTRRYKSVQAIEDDLVDLAGVRVALYFPGDRAEVSRLVEALFDAGLPKPFPEPPKTVPR
jgi:ppGpp synthetase/RelA/SpoT-type nucleotidyltranferase